MSSNDSPELDLDRDLSTTAADVEALHRLRGSRPISTEQYLRFLASLEPESPEAMRSRPGPRGAPFALD